MIRNRAGKSPPKKRSVVDIDEEELKGLLQKEELPTEESDSESDQEQYHSAGFSFNIRYLGFFVLSLLSVSHVLLFRQCAVASSIRARTPAPLIRRWRVATKTTNLSILARPNGKASVRNTVRPGQIVETFGDGTSTYHQILEPTSGFLRRASTNTGLDLLTPIGPVPDSSICPLMYDGWNYEGDAKDYRYAPMPLVIAQQFWNAMQVFALFLLIALNYDCTTCSENDVPFKTKRKWAVRLLTAVGLCILPFSGFLISPGGHIFALVTFGLILIALRTPVSVLRITIGEYDSDGIGSGDDDSSSSSKAASWTLTREETVACCCNLGSSLYNYAGSNATWPHWKTHMKNLDRYMGWRMSGDVTVNENFTLGLKDVHLPLFVARATGGSTSGAQLFSILWSVLPFLYVTYFGCMFVLAPRSPGKNVQRAFIAFGAFHFLFMTDMVAYRYGRGYYTPTGELYHWFEKFAWRTAMLMPLYQNCTNGHWEHGHARFPIAGKVLRRILVAWSVFFFFFQIVQSDVIKFWQFLNDRRQEGLIDRWGLEEAFFFRSVRYPYREALVTMIIMYFTLHFTGFTLFRIFVRRETCGTNRVESVNVDDDRELKWALLDIKRTRMVDESDDDDEAQMEQGRRRRD